MISITRWLYDHCVSLGMEYRFNTYAEADDILGLSPDVVNLATGGLPERGQINGADILDKSTWDFLSGEVPPGKRVLVYDETGGQSGPTVAEYIAGTGSQGDLMTSESIFYSIGGCSNLTAMEAKSTP